MKAPGWVKRSLLLVGVVLIARFSLGQERQREPIGAESTRAQIRAGKFSPELY
jgi:hypothetical protein